MLLTGRLCRGLSLTRMQIHDGHRVTSATSYLARAFDRPNLDILVNTRVTRVLSVGREDGKPVFRSIQFAQTVDGEWQIVRSSMGDN